MIDLLLGVIYAVSWWYSYEKLSMKLALALVVVISTWGKLMFAATSRDITKPKSPPPPPPPPFPTPETMPGLVLVYGFDNAASYSKFIGDLQNKLKDPKRSYFEVPMIRSYPRLQYMYVELKSAAEYTITLAIRITEARLLLTVIQMVSEAIRFQYIEDQIKDNFSDSYAPDPRALDLEKNWEKLTKVIIAANPQIGEISKKELDNLKLSNPDGTPQNVQDVYDIIGDMGLLKYIAASSSLLAIM
ncbi:hypothetical protein Cgig2_016785 [Carnegiea gigantea]|uniref:rRNA N-glycosylase n=1 Tax=Carnegiea gigantea TaxID=171969 RepID=A0A9Q1GWF3_9CARY|nr:hypothetical protein Cgig2_020980 [Carnegiea gigantea]KAJ8428201.1 hypothetical protein Cgig2_016785 [Carnegiea gigantea]